ncbi:nitrous oxide reductase accessory protein NosL [Pusillimonas sp. ANT_WB101]|uniref:nitrous oxide reductase accessory protein NosL n=1 Tax=Pusillimonas sp. ANT_WB101 TaxID=2597356 RepID=UPI0021024806|nr:nitrous oxide reductase accessory protein NosL [Pusillimonas sp. ANT_WB101]
MRFPITPRTTMACLLLVSLLTMAACTPKEQVPAPPPQEISLDAVGHYCSMNLVEHAGPKGQIFIEGRSQPVWFTAIKQVFAYTLLPEEPKAITGIYVNDMGKSKSWDQPDTGAWIAAREAWYVIDSDYVGGMGAEDAVPFGEKAEADSFAAKHGGRVVAYADVPEEYVWRQ